MVRALGAWCIDFFFFLCSHRDGGCTPWLVCAPRARVDGDAGVAAAQILDYLVGDLVP